MILSRDAIKIIAESVDLRILGSQNFLIEIFERENNTETFTKVSWGANN